MKTGVFTFFSGDGIRLRVQRKIFMEKKIKRTEKGKSDSIIGEEKTITLTIVVALVIIGALLVSLVLTLTPKETFSAIYYLDSEKQTENIPKTVVLGENSTFSLWVGVKNQEDETVDYTVKIKVDNGEFEVGDEKVEPAYSFQNKLSDGTIWEFPVTISIERQGNNRVLFELWFFNGTALEFTGNWVNLSIEAVGTI